MVARDWPTCGFVEGRNVAVEHRWAEGDLPRLPDLAADLVARRAAVIVTTSDVGHGGCSRKATTTIPIVFNFISDPVSKGLVNSFMCGRAATSRA